MVFNYSKLKYSLLEILEISHKIYKIVERIPKRATYIKVKEGILFFQLCYLEFPSSFSMINGVANGIYIIRPEDFSLPITDMHQRIVAELLTCGMMMD